MGSFFPQISASFRGSFFSMVWLWIGVSFCPCWCWIGVCLGRAGAGAGLGLCGGVLVRDAAGAGAGSVIPNYWTLGYFMIFSLRHYEFFPHTPAIWGLCRCNLI